MPGPALVRPARAADAAAVAEVYRPYVEQGVASFELLAPGAQELLRRMTAHPLPWLVAERDGAVTGYAYASRHRERAAYRWSVETSVYLAPAEQGRGTGRALYERLIAELTGLGHASAYAGIVLPNPGSVALHEAVGFVPVGVFRSVGHKAGAWHDVGWWQRPLAALGDDPPEPRRWTLPA